MTSSKLPVVQHLPFGRLLPWSDAPGADLGEGALLPPHPHQLGALDTDAIRRGSFGTMPETGQPDKRLAVLEKIKAEKEAAAAAAAAAASTSDAAGGGPPSA